MKIIVLALCAVVGTMTARAQAPASPPSTPSTEATPAKGLAPQKPHDVLDAPAPPKGASRPGQTSPHQVPWNGAKLTHEQQLEMENLAFKIKYFQDAAMQQASKEYMQAAAPFMKQRYEKIQEILKENPGYTWSSEQDNFVPTKPEAGKPAEPASPPAK